MENQANRKLQNDATSGADAPVKKSRTSLTTLKVARGKESVIRAESSMPSAYEENLYLQFSRRNGLHALQSKSHHASPSTASGDVSSTSKANRNSKSSSTSKNIKTMAPKKEPTAPSVSGRRSMKHKVLRVNKPVQTQLNMDIWDRIFANSRPEVLIKFRLVCAGFRDALKPNAGIWKESLSLDFGSALPSPPEGLSWMQYTILLTGRACQACGTKDSTQTFWAFKRKYCKSCIKKKTISRSKLVYKLEEDQLYPKVDELLQSLPRATCALPRHYLHAGCYHQTVNPARCEPGFLWRDVARLQAKFEIVATTAETEAEITGFWEKEIREYNDHVTQLQEIELFVKSHEQGKIDARAANRDAKKAFYKAKAKALHPPIRTEILEGCKSYIQATRSPSLLADCERTWPVLLAKLRKEAQAVRAERAAKERREKREDDMACAHTLAAMNTSRKYCRPVMLPYN